MGFQLGQFAGGAAEKVSSSGPLRSIANPAIATLIVTVLAMIVIFAVFKEESPELSKSSWRIKVRCGIYLFIGVGLVLALHYYGLNRRLEEQYRGDSRNSIVGQIHGAQKIGGDSGLSANRIPISIGEEAHRPAAYESAERRTETESGRRKFEESAMDDSDLELTPLSFAPFS